MRLRAAAIAIAIVASSCTPYADVVRRSFAAEYNCTAYVQKVSSHSFRASGCGVEALYVCSTDAGNRTTCMRILPQQAAAPAPAPAPTPVPLYPYPPVDGRIYRHFDPFERFTTVQADMTIGVRVLRIFGAPRRAADDVFVDVLLPAGPPPGVACSELLLLVGEEVLHLETTGLLTGALGEPLARFHVPVLALDRGVSSGVIQLRFCGVDDALSETQIAAVRVFLDSFRDVARQEPPLPPPAAPAETTAPAPLGPGSLPPG